MGCVTTVIKGRKHSNVHVQTFAGKRVRYVAPHPGTRLWHTALFCSALSGPVAAIEDVTLNILRENVSLRS